ncbi:MAG: hypothetical protein B7Z66_15610 [Chromatiales bacterium 21-64-14]|nr:MAG: hypothetical protein B7Z66_15610 [Chromatiales bacterium 21-64-14]
MLQGAAMNVAGNLYGIGKEVATGNFGHGLAERTSAKFQQQHAYQPASPQGAAALQGASNLLNRSGVAGIAPDMSVAGALGTFGHDAAGQVGRGAIREAGYLGEGARTAAGKIGPLVPEPVKAAGRTVAKPFHYLGSPEASAGAKGARAMAGDLAAQVPAPGAKPVTPEPPPMPQGALQLPRMGGDAKPSTIQINEGLAKAMEARNVGLEQARKAAGDNIEATVANTPQAKLTEDSPLYKDLGGIKDSLVRAQENAGTSAQRAALQSVINDIEHIRTNSNTPLSSLIELRRQLSQKAKFGEPVSGFDAIGTQAAAKLSQQLNDVLDQHIEGYKAARGQYGDVLDEQQPFRARMLKALGADETTGADLTARVMQSPQNVKLAIEAAGDIKPVDSAIAQRVQADLQGKSIATMKAYVDEHRPILEQLPQAQKTASDMVSRTEATQALQDIQKASQARLEADMALRDKALNQQADIYKQQHQAYMASLETAKKYDGMFRNLNTLSVDKLPDALRNVLNHMYKDDLFSSNMVKNAEKYSEALEKVKAFEKSIQRQKLVRRFTGAATAVGFAQYALHRKMWNIIVGATH